MEEPSASVAQQGDMASAVASQSGESTEVECPICYQEYNQFNKCPRMLECLHVFCTECLHRIQLCPLNSPDPHSLPAISCPLCRHPTPLASGNALSLPCNSRILAQLPPMTFRMPASMAARLATVTQRVVLSLEPNREAHFIILPTVSLRVEQMHPEVPHGGPPGLEADLGVNRQNRNTLLCVQLLALVFWTMFVLTCIVGVLFGHRFFRN